MTDVWKVTATMAGPLAGDAPHLDALLEACMKHDQEGEDSERADRSRACPTVGSIRIPIALGRIDGHQVYRCSSAILAPAIGDRHEHYSQRMDVGHAHEIAPESRKILNTTGGEFKAYRLPLRVRAVSRIVWFAVGNGREIRRVLKRRAFSIGKKNSQGFGRVGEWQVERYHDGDPTWYADCELGCVLMRSLPWCKALPQNLTGYRRTYGACQGPYWHPERFMEIVEPC